MNKSLLCFAALSLIIVGVAPIPHALGADSTKKAHNPLIWADVPDIAMIRVGKTYYMSSTTMHMCPGIPIMESTDLVNWRMASYAYDTLADNEAFRLENGKDAYGKGSWASSLRFHNGVFYVSTFSATSGRTHFYTTRDPERGPWKETSFEPAIGDHSLFFDDDGRAYLVYGNARIEISELKPDLTGIKPGGMHKVLVENVNAVFGTDQGGLNGEGSQLFKINGHYYLFNIASPGSRWARTVIVSRADTLMGPYESRIALDDRGIAQGGLIDTPEGKWYAYLFKDNGAVGRIPYLVPVTWKDGWPVLGENGKVPMTLDIPAGGQGVSGVSGIVASDEFNRKPGDPALPLAWQWNHNPDNKLWSVTQRPGFLRLTTGRVDADLLSARNTLTQRTFGPRSSATTSIDVSGMKDGDYAGIAAFQKRYGFVGVKMSGGARSLVMVSADSDTPEEVASVPLSGKTVHLKVECEFDPAPEVARFSYSLDGRTWTPLGRPSALKYTVPHFMGYRFALFYYSTKTAGGRVDFDYFRIGQGSLLGLAPTLSASTAAASTVIDATKAGVIGDGMTLNTASIQKVIDDCAAGGGGTIHFPAGRYLTGTIQIKSNITLRLAKDATLLGSTDIADYRNLDPLIDGAGDPMGHALVVAVDAENVGIEGEGTIDGQGRELRARQSPYKKRPFLVRWVRCTRVKVRDVHLTHPGAWTLNFFQSKGIFVEGVTIRSRDSGVNNADGIDLDSCQDARITRCDIESGDDAFCLKSTSLVPTRDITATNLTLSTWCNAIKFGTESIGGFENISVSNCRIPNTGMAGIALYTVDGGDLRNVTISDITMDRVGTPVSIRRGARFKTFRDGDLPKTTPGKLADVTIKNVSARNIATIGILINGVPGYPVETLVLENIQIEVPGGGTAEDATVQLPEKENAYPENRMFGETLPAYGIYARHVRGAAFKNIEIKTQKPDARPEKVFINVETAEPAPVAPMTRASLPPLAPRRWITSGPLVHSTADANHPIVAVKDPSVVFHDGRWHIFATTAGSKGWGMAYFNFARWDEAPEAKPFYLDQNPNLAGYNCAPQVFYFRPQKKWYMIFQSQQPRFSTTDNIADPMSWSAPQNFFEGTPKSVVEGWLDYWIICDDTHAYLFFPDDHGRMYRSRTTLAEFPRGFDEPVVVLHKAKNDLFEGSCVYRLKGTNQYLLLVECIGKSGTRYYRAWVANRLDGEWKPLSGADSEETPFAGNANVRTSDGSPLWAEGISHGELLREGSDETMTVDPKNIRFLYQGLPVSSKEPDYVLLPYRLGLLKPSSAALAPVRSPAQSVK